LAFGTRDTLSSVTSEWAIFEARSGHADGILAVIAMISRRGVLIALGWTAYAPRARARDNGQFVDSPLKSWFDQLASGKGLCCSFIDGVSVEDVDWDTNGLKDARGQATYRVRLHGEWINVPADSVVEEPNRFGPAVVWPYVDSSGVTQIRCFLPGAGT
jgi:hypothetical protein